MLKCINGYDIYLCKDREYWRGVRDSNHRFTLYSMVDFETNKDVFNNLRLSAFSPFVEGLIVLYL